VGGGGKQVFPGEKLRTPRCALPDCPNPCCPPAPEPVQRDPPAPRQFGCCGRVVWGSGQRYRPARPFRMNGLETSTASPPVSIAWIASSQGLVGHAVPPSRGRCRPRRGVTSGVARAAPPLPLGIISPSMTAAFLPFGPQGIPAAAGSLRTTTQQATAAQSAVAPVVTSSARQRRKSVRRQGEALALHGPLYRSLCNVPGVVAKGVFTVRGSADPVAPVCERYLGSSRPRAGFFESAQHLEREIARHTVAEPRSARGSPSHIGRPRRAGTIIRASICGNRLGSRQLVLRPTKTAHVQRLARVFLPIGPIRHRCAGNFHPRHSQSLRLTRIAVFGSFGVSKGPFAADTAVTVVVSEKSAAQYHCPPTRIGQRTCGFTARPRGPPRSASANGRPCRLYACAPCPTALVRSQRQRAAPPPRPRDRGSPRASPRPIPHNRARRLKEVFVAISRPPPEIQKRATIAPCCHG